MNFAPYQDQNPETTRALSPPPQGTHSRPFSPPLQSPRKTASQNPWSAINERLPSPGAFERNAETQTVGGGGFGNGVGADERNLDVFSTSLPLRLDYEACLAYLLLPPAGSAFLLIVEHKSDYVRFHAWQSSLLFTFLFVVHLIFSFSKVISYILLVGDFFLIAWLTLNAYRDANTLDRYEVPFFGRIANNFVDDE